MRTLISLILFLLFIDLAFQRCANIASPSGGPRDTIPPVLIESNPLNGSIQYQDKEFTLKFSEFIKADKMQQQLIITPRTENKYKTTIKKNSVIITFEAPFDDSTTYNFNFADAVTDITENNPVVNLSLAFSTGDYIDSLSIGGNVIDLFEQKKVKGYLVGLYPSSDSLDYFKHKPMYFTTTNDSGDFKLRYLKSGIYNLLVFNDDNGNITFDPETEPHGFIQDSIVLDSSVMLAKPIATLLQNIKPIKFINSRPTGPYIELKYSKTIDKYQIKPSYLYHSLTGESKDIIRIYKTDKIAVRDSIEIYSTASDSLDNQTIDTIKTAFIESNRQPSEFTYSTSSSNTFLSDDFKLTLAFSKPVFTVDTTKMYFIKDSTFKQNITPLFSWNENHTKLTLNTRVENRQIVDTITSLLPKDTTRVASELKKRPGETKKSIPPITLMLDTAAFISIENDTSDLISLNVPLQESSAFGTVKLTIQTDKSSFNIQLIDGRKKVVYSSWNKKTLTFPKVKPGNYLIRALIDNNNDGKWSVGNLLLNTVPEELYLHKEETAVRENWLLEIAITF